MDIVFNSVQTVEIPSSKEGITKALNELALACLEESDYFTSTAYDKYKRAYINSKKCNNLFSIYNDYDDSTYSCLGGQCMPGYEFDYTATPTFILTYYAIKGECFFWGLNHIPGSPPGFFSVIGLDLIDEFGNKKKVDYCFFETTGETFPGTSIGTGAYLEHEGLIRKDLNNQYYLVMSVSPFRNDGSTIEWTPSANQTYFSYSFNTLPIELIPVFDYYEKGYSDRLFFAPSHNAGAFDGLIGGVPGPYKIGQHYYLKLTSCLGYTGSWNGTKRPRNISFFYLLS